MRHIFSIRLAMATVALSAGWSVPVHAEDKPPLRVRVELGPQLTPSFPGARRVSLGPAPDFSFARGDNPFVFEAPDESIGFPVLQGGGFGVGPALNFQGSRTAKDVGAALPKVGFTVEVGGFVQYQLGKSIRLRAEGQRGIGGHRGWIGMVSADYIARDQDRWLFSVGPRLTLSDRRYNRAYFGVAPADAPAAGLTPFTARGGVEAVGAAAQGLRQITRRWGVSAFAKYDRLVADAARSPIVRVHGSRNQYSGGVALSYTFGRNVK